MADDFGVGDVCTPDDQPTNMHTLWWRDGRTVHFVLVPDDGKATAPHA